jgi:hypothetical protein
MHIIEVDNGRMRFWLLPERGMGIWKVWLDGVEIGWQSPIQGPVHPHYVPIYKADGLGWLAGFDELLCRCGLESNGAPEFDANMNLQYPLHGRIANLPAHHVVAGFQNDSQNISVAGRVAESCFKSQSLELSSTTFTRLGSSKITIRDRVTNHSAMPGEFQLLYHINFGAPLLGKGAEVIAPVKTLVPRTPRAEEGVAHWANIAEPESGFQEQVYFMELLGDLEGRSQVLLRNAEKTQGVSLHFNLTQLPCFTLWKNTASQQEGYVTGLEPGTNFPNPRSFELKQGRVVSLRPSESRDFELSIEFHTDATSVAEANREIVEYQSSRQAQIHDSMQPGWTVEATPSNLDF